MKQNATANKNSSGQNARTGAASGKNATMKTNKMQDGGTLTLAGCGHNVLAVTEDGSPISTQVWDGGTRAAAATLLSWYDMGEANRGQSSHWTPITHGFLHSHATRETRHYDLGNPEHLAALRQMAMLSQS
jgi:hypothetical protein